MNLITSAEQAEQLSRNTSLRVATVYGGVGYGEQLDAFKAGAHLVIGTPGRIIDHLTRRSLTLENLKFLIFDEADRMLSMGFYPDMRRVQYYLPERPVSTFMFSATFPSSVISLASQFMHKPGFMNLSSDHIHVTTTEHVFYSVPGMDKDRSLVRIIEVENPPSAATTARALHQGDIFLREIRSRQRLTKSSRNLAKALLPVSGTKITSSGCRIVRSRAM